MTRAPVAAQKIDYGIDAPTVLRNFFLAASSLLLIGAFLPKTVHLGHVSFGARATFLGTGFVVLLEGLAYLHYVKRGKFRHRDFILGMHDWRGDEQVLDVGCGRGLLLIGAAKRLTSGRATGIDVWSTEDLSGNDEDAARVNIALENVADRADVLSVPAQSMSFADDSFDVVVSNLCLHNIYDKEARTEALRQIARVLKPGGVVLLSDYKLTGEYAAWFGALPGWMVERRWGNPLHTFPPLRVVVARKPQA